MNMSEDEASVRSRESVDSLPTMKDAGSETQSRRTACTLTRSERALEGKRD